LSSTAPTRGVGANALVACEHYLRDSSDDVVVEAVLPCLVREPMGAIGECILPFPPNVVSMLARRSWPRPDSSRRAG
jgi:hypothetical protein